MKRYLLIDDEEIFNFIQSEVISGHDATDEVVAYSSASEALAYLQDQIAGKKNLPDFIFLDVRMPVMNGFDFLESFIKLDAEAIKDVKIYMLSSSLDEKDHQRALSFPHVKGFKSKPLTDEIIDEINS
ncbi:MAG: response regulator [Bacteroidota bacterium]|jgi:CheY-like chemotaxis protein